jgi:hypothetical protein
LPSVLLLAIATALCALCCCCRWRLPSLLRTVQCAAAAPRGSARVGTPQLATTSRELEQTRACGKKNENKSKKGLQQSSLQLHSVENR